MGDKSAIEWTDATWNPDTGGPTASARDFQAVIAFRDGAGS